MDCNQKGYRELLTIVREWNEYIKVDCYKVRKYS
jgi:hypothetical protein